MRTSLCGIHGRLDSAEGKIGEFVYMSIEVIQTRYKTNKQTKPEKINRTSVTYRIYKMNQYM